MMNDTKKVLLEEKRTKNMNTRVEATQTINPVTGLEYLNFDYPQCGRFEDPIQAHLRVMEEKNPSTNEHKQRLLKTLIDRLSFIDRTLQYRKGDIALFKIGKKDNKEFYVLDSKNTLYLLLKEYPLRYEFYSLNDIIKKQYKGLSYFITKHL